MKPMVVVARSREEGEALSRLGFDAIHQTFRWADWQYRPYAGKMAAVSTAGRWPMGTAYRLLLAGAMVNLYSDDLVAWLAERGHWPDDALVLALVRKLSP